MNISVTKMSIFMDSNTLLKRRFYEIITFLVLSTIPASNTIIKFLHNIKNIDKSILLMPNM